jgi:hypothetical protein
MDQDIRDRLSVLETKLDSVFVSTERTRTYIKWTLIATVAFFVLPLIGLVFAIPANLKTLTDITSF